VGKGPEAFRTIGEVAEDLDVPKHVLRFWETKFTHLKPMKRGGGRRYYRPEDVELLRGIRMLLHEEGYTIRGLQRVFRQQGVNYIKNYPNRSGPAAQPQQGSARVPDVAGEAAGHAREAAMRRAKAPANRGRSGTALTNAQNRQPEAGAPGTDNAPPLRLSPTPAGALERALAELEECRQMLSAANAV
jgi:DNA-binding transcriptional MerR regulator